MNIVKIKKKGVPHMYFSAPEDNFDFYQNVMPQVVYWAGEPHWLHVMWCKKVVNHTDLGHKECPELSHLCNEGRIYVPTPVTG